MTLDVFKQALKCEPGVLFCIGGGEPTCHPLFWDFLDEAISARGPRRVWLATNGKLKDHAMRLADMVENRELRAVLSQDEWHEPIDPEVVSRWSMLRNANGKSAVRNVGRTDDGEFHSIPIKSGSCDWGIECCVDENEVFIQADGGVRQCACLDAPVVGDVFRGYTPMFQGEDKWACWAGRGNPKHRMKNHRFLKVA